MVKIGDKVRMKSNDEAGCLKSIWNPHIVNPNVFDEDTPMGYCVVLEDGRNVICTIDDFAVIES